MFKSFRWIFIMMKPSECNVPKRTRPSYNNVTKCCTHHRLYSIKWKKPRIKPLASNAETIKNKSLFCKSCCPLTAFVMLHPLVMFPNCIQNCSFPIPIKYLSWEPPPRIHLLLKMQTHHLDLYAAVIPAQEVYAIHMEHRLSTCSNYISILDLTPDFNGLG